ncbi:hypothetical protein M231_00178 [Tremella mesenterica]|uniref:Uncharacterized protein n=1 Tax=Tremella mesenterica TaxID=5217 RepID=A0A4Q1BWS4_TREME|nr:hypothetical protein M231_00178 [Tremella mesenterica]
MLISAETPEYTWLEPSLVLIKPSIPPLSSLYNPYSSCVEFFSLPKSSFSAKNNKNRYSRTAPPGVKTTQLSISDALNSFPPYLASASRTVLTQGTALSFPLTRRTCLHSPTPRPTQH